MILKQLAIALCTLTLGASAAAADYAPAGNRIRTPWAETVTPQNAWRAYPRPQMKRTQWENLNGLWQYSVTDKDATKPNDFKGEILVPYPYESSLSGVAGKLGPDSILWYSRTFTVPKKWKGNDIILNFGAVDWKCTVWVNGKEVGTHTGGYTPFSINITHALNAPGKQNTLTVSVYDPSDKGYQPRGKQVARPHGIWYTPVSGIWQTVWLEPVPAVSIYSIYLQPDLTAGTITLNHELSSTPDGLTIEAIVKDGDKTVATAQGVAGQPLVIKLSPGFKTWTPDSPNLYDVTVNLKKGSKTIDHVQSYTAMRQFGMERGDDGHIRLTLNGSPLFQFGPLDQGWWPDGLYTAPSPEALAYDIIKTKDLGFNMIRKHVKVEPALWYQLCDSLGMIVWQDMPSGDRGPGWNNKTYYDGADAQRTDESAANFIAEWTDIINNFKQFPCIGVWVPFNESWGQFRTEEITDLTKHLDPTRLVNCASGGNFYRCGDILDLHNYPQPDMYLYDPDRANVMGEYGGIGLPLEGHLWNNDKKNWGYVKFQSPAEVTAEYIKYARILQDLIKKGFTAAVYTQTTDVEGEVNGLMTYDRKVTKVIADSIRPINSKIVHILDKDL